MGPHRDPHWKYKALSKVASVRGWKNLAKDLTWLASPKSISGTGSGRSFVGASGRTLGAASIPGALAALVGGRSKRIGAPALKAKRHKNKMAYSRRSKRVRVARDGVKKTKGNRRRKKHRKVSLSKRIAHLEKNKSPQGRMTKKSIDPYQMINSVPNQEHLFVFPGLFRTVNDTHVADLPFDTDGTTVNYTVVNSSIKVRNQYVSFEFVNQGTINITVRYAFYICQDDTSVEPLVQLKTHLDDRGMVVAAVPFGGCTPSALQAACPQILKFDGAEMMFPKLGAMDRKWKRSGPKVVTLSLGPGDSFKCSIAKKNMLYRPEVIDRTSATYYKGDSILMMTCKGSQQYESGDTNPNLVSLSGFAMTGMRSVSRTYIGNSLKAQNLYTHATTLDSTNVTENAVHADNHISAKEKQNV